MKKQLAMYYSVFWYSSAAELALLLLYSILQWKWLLWVVLACLVVPAVSMYLLHRENCRFSLFGPLPDDLCDAMPPYAQRSLRAARIACNLFLAGYLMTICLRLK